MGGARQWAGARVDDLLEEIALGGDRPELQGEVLDRALAYNFATPYTAFLAIPGSELDWQSAHALAIARSYKADILKRKPDAARVAGRGAAPSADEVGPESAPASRLSWEDTVAEPASSNERALAMNENPLSEEAEVGRLQPVKQSRLGRSDVASGKHAGCASCALGGTSDAPFASIAFAGVIVIVGFVRRRRR